MKANRSAVYNRNFVRNYSTIGKWGRITLAAMVMSTALTGTAQASDNPCGHQPGFFNNAIGPQADFIARKNHNYGPDKRLGTSDDYIEFETQRLRGTFELDACMPEYGQLGSKIEQGGWINFKYFEKDGHRKILEINGAASAAEVKQNPEDYKARVVPGFDSQELALAMGVVGVTLALQRKKK